MKIAMVAGPYLPVPPTKYGGIEQVIYHIVNGLVEAGHEPILLATADSKIDCPIVPIAERALNFAKIEADTTQHQKQVDKILKLTAQKLKELAPQVDVIHSHGFSLKEFNNFPCVTTLHNPFAIMDLSYLQWGKNLNYVFISKDQKSTFPKQKYSSVIYNGENPADFPIVERPDDYVCFLSRLDEAKNPDLAIRLAIGARVKIKVAGKIDHQGAAYFEKKVKPLLGHPLVEWLGEVEPEEKVSILAKSRCNLHATGFREPFGLTVIEAAYCGTPTLAVKLGALGEVVEAGRTGMLVDRTADFASSISLLKKCFELDRLDIAKRSRSRFNYRKMTKQYLKAYEQTIRNNLQTGK